MASREKGELEGDAGKGRLSRLTFIRAFAFSLICHGWFFHHHSFASQIPFVSFTLD